MQKIAYGIVVRSILLGFAMDGVFATEPAIFIHFQSVRVVLLVFHCVVVALLAVCASKCDFDSHNGTSRWSEICCVRHAIPCTGRARPPSEVYAHQAENERTKKEPPFEVIYTITQKICPVKGCSEIFSKNNSRWCIHAYPHCIHLNLIRPRA